MTFKGRGAVQLTRYMSTLEKDILDSHADHLAKEIDFQFMTAQAVLSGWTKIILTPMSGEKSEAINQWLDTECRGKYNTMGLVFVFERQQDAAMFALTFV